MYALTFIAYAAALAVVDGPDGGAVEESREVYEIVAATAVPVLPPPLRDFFEDDLSALERTAAELAATSSSHSLSGKADWHYIKLDISTDDTDAATRHTAARAFPRRRTAAAKLLQRLGRRDWGLLAWVIRDRYSTLVDSFRIGKAEVIVRRAGALLHYATDAVLPFNTTTDRDGTATGNLYWSADGDESSTSLMHRTVRHRFQLGLPRWLRIRFGYEVRVAPERYSPIANPIDEVFDALLEAHRSLDALLRIDAEATADLGIRDARTFMAASDAYYDYVSDRAASIIESRLEAGSLLAANLIGGAWVQAGSPPPGAWEAPAPVLTGRSNSVEPRPDPFVGSRNSTIFHRTDCSHATRIKPANLIYFKTAREAEHIGRSPCRSCRPGDS